MADAEATSVWMRIYDPMGCSLIYRNGGELSQRSYCSPMEHGPPPNASTSTHAEAVDMALSPDERSLYFWASLTRVRRRRSDIWVSDRTDNGGHHAGGNVVITVGE